MQNNIDRDAYLFYAKQISEKEQLLITEFEEWLPPEIIDCHTHCNSQRDVDYVNEESYKHMLSTFPSFSLQESEQWNNLFHPGKIVHTLRFPGVFKGINHKEANLYLLEQSPQKDRVAIYGLPDEIDYTIEALNYKRVSAIKMYYSYNTPAAKEIYQYFPKEVLRVAEEKNIPIVLHLPKPMAECMDQILRLIEDFPRLNICLAHMGLTKHLTNDAERAFLALAHHKLVLFDTALISSSEVIEAAIHIVGSHRIMYGSDAPLDLIRSIEYLHPKNGWRLATQYPYHWTNQEERQKYGYLAIGATHDHWHTLEAIKKAVSQFPQNESEDIKKEIFFENAKNFYDFN